MRLRFAFLLLIGLSGPSQAQSVITSASPAKSTRLSCDYALQLLSAEASSSPVDSSLYRFTRREESDEVLRRLTDLALRDRCPAAFGARGLVKQQLAQTDWIPKDGPGQRAGVPWREDALYDLALATKAGGPAGEAAATVATRLLLPDKVDRPYLVRELGPTFLAVPVEQSSIPDTIKHALRGRLAAWLWRPPVADSAFSAYLAAGGSEDRAALELARLRLASATAGADTLYYQAAASGDPAVLRELRYDLAFVADSQELRMFDRLEPGDRGRWLRRFWEQRDLESLRPRGSRLQEHYERIGIARQRFRLLTYPRHYELNELWVNPDAEYDDRGLVYIRHGRPDQTASAVRAGACPNTSWLFRRPDGNMIFHFVARQHPNDWRLVETLANAAGESGATTRVRRAGSESRCGAVDGLLESRMSLDPIYASLAGNQSRRNWERELAMTTRSREIGTTTDSHVLRFPSALEVSWRAYGLLGTPPAGGRALVLVSVPTATLTPISQQPLAYSFRMRLVARSASRIVELDSVRNLGVKRRPKPGEMVTFTTELPLSAGNWRLGVSLEQAADAAGEVLIDSVVPVPDAASRTLDLSDIVLGDPTGGRPWTAPDGPFPLSSTGSYIRGEPVPIYYEVAGTSTPGEIETEITLVRDDGEGKSTIRFTERMERSIARIRRELNTSKSRPGRYALRLTAKTPDGRRALRETTLIVTPREK